MDELKPCPFCGSPAEMENGRNDRPWVVECPNRDCHAQPFMDHADSRFEAIAAWNTRTPSEPAATDERVDGTNAHCAPLECFGAATFRALIESFSEGCLQIEINDLLEDAARAGLLAKTAFDPVKHTYHPDCCEPGDDYWIPTEAGQAAFLPAPTKAVEPSLPDDDAGLVERLRTQADGMFFPDCLEAETMREAANALVEAREALEKIERAPAWGAPDRWETTPAEVRQLARDALRHLSGEGCK